MVQAVILKDCRLSVRMIPEETGLDINTVHKIQTHENICGKLVLNHLSVEQKSQPVGDLLRFAVELKLDKVITEDELWVFEYNQEIKQHSR